MKKYLLLIFAIGIVNMLSATQAEYDSLRIKADELYREGKSDTAYWLYEGLIKEGLEDAYLFANIGNAALQQNKLAEAVLWYEKSLHLNPDNELVKNNQKYALNKLEQEYQKQGQFERILKSTALSMALWWLSAALLALVLFVNRRFIRIVSGIMTAVTLLTAIVLTFSLGIFHSESQAIVLSDAAVYSMPSELSDEVFEFSSGNKIHIIKQENNWCQVRLGKRKKGWVRSAHIALVK